MKQLDLGPNHYRKRDPRTGRWHLPDDPKLARNYFFVLLAVLAFVYVTRDAGSRESLFGITALFSLCAGGMLVLWLKRPY